MQAEPDYPAGLPEADPESMARSKSVADFIAARIDGSGGSIGFDEYMQHALYAPGLGYYVAGSSKFGAQGDFVTAPEVSPLFASVVGRQCAGIISALDKSSVLELGAGSGALALHLLRTLRRVGAMPEKYLILEPSPDLQSRQKSLLEAELPEEVQRVEWIDRLPREFVGVVLANEVMDALPFARFVIRTNQVRELRVTLAQGRFVWLEQDATKPLYAAVRQIEQDIGESLPDGYVSEVCLALQPWIGDIARCISEGFVFLFDYGVSRREYYAADRSSGWLRCHFRHRAHDNPFINAGIQDLTSWVDFSVVAAAAARNGMAIEGYTNQAQFLLGGGLIEELERFSTLSAAQQLELSRQVKLLTVPGEMGENFKCIGLAKGGPPRPTAFDAYDRAQIL
jgi:SAM-dependent MidA family methyltransferase